MSEIVIFGAGRMGRTIAYGMDRLGHSVYVVDQSGDNLALLGNEFKKVQVDDLSDDNLEKVMVTYHKRFVETFGASASMFCKPGKPDMVISALPYFLNARVASWCIENEVAYVDLGGRVDVSAGIKTDSEKMGGGACVFTDLGLAPGWINIVATHLIKENKDKGVPNSVWMAVGGLPNTKPYRRNNPLGYYNTWSAEGLINEYVDECRVLTDGKIVTEPGMANQRLLHLRSIEYEAFNTSGGIAHSLEYFQSLGITNARYQTLRYPGHIDIVRFLLDSLGREATVTALASCGETVKDKIIMAVKLTYKDEVVNWDEIITFDDKFTGMQKCTAFPLCAAAQCILDRRSLRRKNVLSYEDIPYEDFVKNLEVLGL